MADSPLKIFATPHLSLSWHDLFSLKPVAIGSVTSCLPQLRSACHFERLSRTTWISIK